MNRLITKLSELGGKKLLGLKQNIPSEPSAWNMQEFASQFTLNEWIVLCKDREFMTTIDQDLVKASTIAASLLDRCALFLQAEKYRA